MKKIVLKLYEFDELSLSDLRERHPRCHGRRYRWSRRVWVRRSGKRGVRPCSLDWLNR